MMMMMLLLIIIIIWAPPRAQSPACRRVGRRRRPPLKLLPVPNERERKPERITEEAGSAGTSSAPALAVCSLRPPLPQPRAAHQGSRPLPEGLQIFFFLSTTSPTQGGENPGVPYPPPPPPWLLCVVVLDRASVEESFSNVTAGDGSGPAPRSPRRAPGAGRSGGEWPQLRPRPHGAGDWNPSGGKAAARFSRTGAAVRPACAFARSAPRLGDTRAARAGSRRGKRGAEAQPPISVGPGENQQKVSAGTQPPQ